MVPHLSADTCTADRQGQRLCNHNQAAAAQRDLRHIARVHILLHACCSSTTDMQPAVAAADIPTARNMSADSSSFSSRIFLNSGKTLLHMPHHSEYTSRTACRHRTSGFGLLQLSAGSTPCWLPNCSCCHLSGP
eukprot:GHUV01032674.1.p2 GENE.GHUV01032674.1~~GHUV01032674.1.p2  ORF type:complete len:134 (+),score=31.94 GHUV01032674.1:318-719(+)